MFYNYKNKYSIYPITILEGYRVGALVHKNWFFSEYYAFVCNLNFKYVLKLYSSLSNTLIFNVLYNLSNPNYKINIILNTYFSKQMSNYFSYKTIMRKNFILENNSKHLHLFINIFFTYITNTISSNLRAFLGKNIKYLRFFFVFNNINTYSLNLIKTLRQIYIKSALFSNLSSQTNIILKPKLSFNNKNLKKKKPHRAVCVLHEKINFGFFEQ